MNKINTIKLQELSSMPLEKLAVIPVSHSEVEAHEHQFFELAYVIGGTCIHEIDQGEITLRVGDYFFVEYGMPHGYHKGDDFTVLNCVFLPEAIDQTLEGCESFDDFIQNCLLKYYKLTLGMESVNRLFHDDTGEIYRLLKGMEVEYEKKLIGYEEIFRCRMQEILILTMRKILQSTRITTQNIIIKDLLKFAEKNYNKRNLLKEFSQMNHYNSQYIGRQFQKETGVKFKDYIQKLRIEKSCELLKGTDKSITEIAFFVGYLDLKSFQALFKKYMKMTPREFKKGR